MCFANSLTHRFIRNPRGATIIEFAILAPFLFYTLFFIIELGLIGFSMVSIENAVNSALRAAKVGERPPGITRDAYIRSEIRNRAFGLLSKERLVITNEVSNLATDLPNIGPEFCIEPGVGFNGTTCPCPAPLSYEDRNGNLSCDATQPTLDTGNPGEIVNYTVVYRWKPLTPILGNVLAEEVVIVSGGAVRNEEF